MLPVKLPESLLDKLPVAPPFKFAVTLLYELPIEPPIKPPVVLVVEISIEVVLRVLPELPVEPLPKSVVELAVKLPVELPMTADVELPVVPPVKGAVAMLLELMNGIAVAIVLVIEGKIVPVIGRAPGMDIELDAGPIDGLKGVLAGEIEDAATFLAELLTNSAAGVEVAVADAEGAGTVGARGAGVSAVLLVGMIGFGLEVDKALEES